MITLFITNPYSFWFSLGGLLLIIEMLGGNGYLLWSGIASLVTGLLCWIFPFGWQWQGTLFAFLTLLTTWLWSRWLHRQAKRQSSAEPGLNQPGKQLIGRTFTLDKTLVNSRGNVHVGDSSWPVVADSDLLPVAR